MAKYVRDTFFSSTNFSADVTVRTWNRDGNGEWEYINCIANRRMLKESQPAAGGYHEYPIDFTEGSYAPDGPDLTPSLTRSGSLTQFANKIYTVTVDNVGDGATFDDIVVTVDLPDSLDYISSSASCWTIEYSENNGSSYSGTPPGDLTGVTNLRYTRTTPIDAGADASFTFTIYPTLAIAVQTDVAVTTTGDTA
jgi:hypothetical protein